MITNAGSRCYACEHYDFEIVYGVEKGATEPKWYWQHICKISRRPGDEVVECDGFTEAFSSLKKPTAEEN